MKIFAIGDLHLSGSVDKPMNIFGDHWEGHDKKIFQDWSSRVSAVSYTHLTLPTKLEV